MTLAEAVGEAGVEGGMGGLTPTTVVVRFFFVVVYFLFFCPVVGRESFIGCLSVVIFLVFLFVSFVFFVFEQAVGRSAGRSVVFCARLFFFSSSLVELVRARVLRCSFVVELCLAGACGERSLESE